ncbi:hypothetical protein ACFO6R_12650 [Eubacterium multiforme]|uniref:Uncharacterized protein n=1 Tax=Eubacterium multiforme TaxID=83339 RepID=A0ABT9UWB4_9FIRM|nr:hypothetical protein [Eubacterium multiforme]MDQ0150581.1 hypothetical protein [Eubacterium multiforme]
MKLRKDDPIYYKKKMNELIKQAKENNVDVVFEKGFLKFIAYADMTKFGIDVEEVICQTSINLKEI